MGNSGLIALLLGGAAVAGGIGYYEYTKKSSSTPSPSVSSQALTLSGKTNVQVGNSYSYSVSAVLNGKPVADESISIFIDGSESTVKTDSNGIADFSVKFSTAGSKTIYAEYNGIKSNSLDITASTSPPPSACSGNSSCPPGSDCIGGVCTPLEATSINVPQEVSLDGYLEAVRRIYDAFFPEKYFYQFQSSYNKSCPKNYTGNSSASIEVNVNGTVLTGDAGINQAPLDVSISGPSSWTGPYSMYGSCKLTADYPANADSNGNFTIKLILTLDIEGNPTGANSNTFSPEAISIDPFTVKVSSMGISQDFTVVPNLLAYELECYYYGIPADVEYSPILLAGTVGKYI
jgi:hypothetical protein